MNTAWLSLVVFGVCYVLFVLIPNRRSLTACGGGLLLVLTGALGWRTALLEKVSWNVMGLFVGTLVLAELFMLSRAPAVIAEWLVDRTRTARGAMLAICVFAGVVSMFVENVAVVLLLAPVALSLADKLRVRPVPLLIGIAISSNLQGTATMIGDPPSMILAGYLHMGFLDFFVYRSRPGIFFAVQIGALASLAVLAWIFRAHHLETKMIPQERARSWMPSAFLVILALGLSVATVFDPDFAWFAGTYTMGLAVLSLVWHRLAARWQPSRGLLTALDWDTTFFLVGVFLLVGALSDSGWLTVLASAISGTVGQSPALAFVAILLLSVVVSGFVDNVPFLLAMIPVTQMVADKIHVELPLLMFGLLIGACLGGNLTPIGASANVVAIGILRKRGYTVGFTEFMRIGIPFTVAAVAAAGLFVWFIWGP